MDDGYKRLFVMLSISFLIMYSVLFLNVEKWSHVVLSLSRVYVTLLMVTPMAILMLLLMPKMFMNKKMNLVIHGVSALLFILALVFLRTQTPIGDLQYMKAMIPHHSVAILNSKQAQISDPEVKELSIEIIRAQEEEIAEMERLISKLENAT
jgi:hypothetical protein